MRRPVQLKPQGELGSGWQAPSPKASHHPMAPQRRHSVKSPKCVEPPRAHRRSSPCAAELYPRDSPARPRSVDPTLTPSGPGLFPRPSSQTVAAPA